MHLSWRNCMEYRNDWPNDWSNCLIFGDLLTNMLLILRMRCSAVYLVNEIFIFLESIKSPGSSTFCVVIKTDLRVYIENPDVLNKSTVAFILFIHYCSVSLCKQESSTNTADVTLISWISKTGFKIFVKIDIASEWPLGIPKNSQKFWNDSNLKYF